MSENMSKKLRDSYANGFDNTDGSKEIFGTWTTYEEDINGGRWLAPVKTAAYVMHNFNPDVEIGDIACGTGLVAKHLRPAFYDNVDGYDITVEFLEKAKEFYRDTAYNDICADPLPKKYDVITASGCFAPGHLSAKPSKNIANSLKENGVFVMTNPSFREFGHAILGPNYSYIEEGGWNAQTDLTMIYESDPYPSLQHNGRQNYHRIRAWKRTQDIG
jgi:SAM-dependent methyltransferase